MMDSFLVESRLARIQAGRPAPKRGQPRGPSPIASPPHILARWGRRPTALTRTATVRISSQPTQGAIRASGDTELPIAFPPFPAPHRPRPPDVRRLRIRYCRRHGLYPAERARSVSGSVKKACTLLGQAGFGRPRHPDSAVTILVWAGRPQEPRPTSATTSFACREGELLAQGEGLQASWRWPPKRTGRSRSRWRTRVIIELR